MATNSDLGAFRKAASRAMASMKDADDEGLRRGLARKFRAADREIEAAYIHRTPLALLDVVRGRLPDAVLAKSDGDLCVLRIKSSPVKWFATTAGCAARTAHVQADVAGMLWYIWPCDDTNEERLCAL